MYSILEFLRKILPPGVLLAYHRTLATLARVWYGDPSSKMIVIGVTGTNGKTTTSYLISKALEAGGDKTGCTSTALFKIADQEVVNDLKMTMPGRFRLQKILRAMIRAGCKYAVVETSSQGIMQNRHNEIAYDVCVFTNLTPEHIEAHGGFENYKRAKLALFQHAVHLPPKDINGHAVPRLAILNRDDEHVEDFVMSGFDRIHFFGLENDAEYRGSDVQVYDRFIEFSLGDDRVRLNIPGRVNVYNALAAIAVADSLGLDRAKIFEKLGAIKNMPGRFECIDEGQSYNVIVDYAYEPAALNRLFDFVDSIRGSGRVIHVTGSAGGGRDVSRRQIIGELSATRADITIVTNEDPYDEDPQSIIDSVADAAVRAGRVEQDTLFRILDRAEAIQKAISLARAGDTVLITGKGSEPVMAVAHGKKIPWDDRQEVRDAIRNAAHPLN